MTTMMSELPMMRVSAAKNTLPIKVLDEGRVELVDWMGDDHRVAQVARISFEKKSLEFSKADANLVNFLARNNHMSPFRHEFISFSIKAPLMVARQHWKYVVGSDHTMDAWNEASRRYVTSKEEFYVPTAGQWRSAPENKKQGSGELLPAEIGSQLFLLLLEDGERQTAHYKLAMEMGACAEQARLFLLAYGLYISYTWTASLQSVIYFLSQRLADDAQKEIQDYAKAIHILAQPLFPVTFEVFNL